MGMGKSLFAKDVIRKGYRMVWSPEKCWYDRGCRLCELACPLGALKVGELSGLSLCRNCLPVEYAACRQACKRKAILEKEKVVAIDRKLCDGCGECAVACPYNGIRMNGKEAVKCDLCGGDPLCAFSCPFSALALEEMPDYKDVGLSTTLQRGVGAGVEGVYSTGIGWHALKCGEAKGNRYKNKDGLSVNIYRDNGNMRYDLSLPVFGLDELRQMERCKYLAIVNSKVDPFSPEPRMDKVRKFAEEVKGIAGKMMQLSQTKLDELSHFISIDCVGLGPVSYLLGDRENLEEIEVIGQGKEVRVYHRVFGRCCTNIVIDRPEAITELINKLARSSNRRISKMEPKLEVELEDGSRLTAGIPPISLSPMFSIRLFSHSDPYTLPKLVANGTIDERLAVYLWLAIENGKNILISGASGSGKTTLLSCLYQLCLPHERVITIEDLPELRLNGKHFDVVSLIGNDTIGITRDDLLKSCLRLRPDRLVLGELRGAEARTLFSAVNTGQVGGFASTCHSNTGAAEVLNRLSSEPMNVSLSQLREVDVLVAVKNTQKGRKIEDIVELDWGKGKPGKRWVKDELSCSLREVVNVDESMLTNEAFTKMGKKEIGAELERRRKFLLKHRESGFDKFCDALAGFYTGDFIGH